MLKEKEKDPMAERNAGIPIEKVLPLSREQVRSLNQRWIATDREFLALTQEKGWREELAELLGADLNAVEAWRNQLIDSIPAEEHDQILFCAHGSITGLGLLESELDDLEDLAISTPMQMTVGPGVPSKVDLWKKTLPVGNQGSRGTCVAWSISFEYNYLWQEILQNEQHFSPQFAYWTYKHERDRDESPGTSFHTGIRGASRYGICIDALWPYNPEPEGTNESQHPPPGGCAENARKFLCEGFLSPQAEDIVRKTQMILLGIGRFKARPVVIGVPVYTSWANSETYRSGKIFMPSSNDSLRGNHAMLVEGYRTDGDWGNAPGGGVFVVRNSWGKGWAAESPIKPGYAIMSFDYVSSYAFGAFGLVPSEEAAVVTASDRDKKGVTEGVHLSSNARAKRKRSLRPVTLLFLVLVLAGYWWAYQSDLFTSLKRKMFQGSEFRREQSIPPAKEDIEPGGADQLSGHKVSPAEDVPASGQEAATSEKPGSAQLLDPSVTSPGEAEAGNKTMDMQGTGQDGATETMKKSPSNQDTEAGKAKGEAPEKDKGSGGEKIKLPKKKTEKQLKEELEKLMEKMRKQSRKKNGKR